MFRVLLPTLFAVLPLGAQAPRHHHWIPADAELVVHVDVQALARSVLGKKLLGKVRRMDLDDVGGLQVWVEQHDVDLGRDIASVTIYGAPPEDSDPVLIVVMAEAMAKLFDDIESADGGWTKTVDGREVHSFRAGHDRVYAHTLRLGDGHDAVVFTQDLDQLGRAAGLVEGRGDSLAGSNSPLAARRPGADVFAHVAVIDVRKLVDMNPSSALLKEASAFSLEVGETGADVFARLAIRGKDEESSTNIASMAQGLIALARLVANNEDKPQEIKRERLRLLNALQVESEGAELRVHFRYPAEKLADALKDR